MSVKLSFQFIARVFRYLFYGFIFSQATSCFAGDYWEDNAYKCQAPSGYQFPAKIEIGQCADGDSTLFNGLFCASGDQRGCDAVKNSQTSDGEFWRSPRRAETNNLGKGDTDKNDLPFSDDQNMGVLLYVITTGDTAALQRWLDWLEKNRACSIDLSGRNCSKDSDPRYYQKGLPRYCRHANCTLQPIYRDMIMEVASHYNLQIPSGIAHYYAELSKLSLGFVDVLLGKYGLGYLDFSTSEKVAVGALLDESGFPLHLDAVRALILKKLGNSDAAIDNAVANFNGKEPGNPFFQYIKQGATKAVADRVVQLCPSATQPLDDLNYRDQYTWEQSNSSQWSNPLKKDGKVRGMLWDCIMMRNLSPALYSKPFDPSVLSVINALLLEDEPCTVTVTPITQPVAYQGGDFTANITAPATCAWTANANTSWLTIGSGATGQGNGTVQYQIPTNTSYKPVSYSITVKGDNSQTISINQEANPGITINNAAVLEGATGTLNTVTFKVSLNIKPTQTVTVDYATKDGTAKAGLDYQTLTGRLSFLKGQASKLVTVKIIGDNVREKNEAFNLIVSNSKVPFGLIRTAGVGTIKNDD